jgi:hypothetical protein
MIVNLHGDTCGLDSTDNTRRFLVCLCDVYKNIYICQFMNKVQFTVYWYFICLYGLSGFLHGSEATGTPIHFHLVLRLRMN